MNFVISEIAENARLAAAFYNGFAQLLEGDQDQDEAFKLLANVFDIGIRYGDNPSHLEPLLLGYLGGAYENESVKDFDAREAHLRGAALMGLMHRISKADLTSDALLHESKAAPATSPVPDRGAALTR